MNREEKRAKDRARKTEEWASWSPDKRQAQNEYLRQWRKNNPDYDREHDKANSERRRRLARERYKRPEVKQAASKQFKKWRNSLSPEQKEALLAYNRQYSKAHPDSIRRPHRDKIARMKNPVFGVIKNLRRRVHHVIKDDYKSAHTLDLLGCTIDQFLGHLEINFQDGMTWENYGKVWHVDHKKPCAAFDLTRPEEQRACFNWKNLQPLFAKENLAKGARCAEGNPLKERNL